MPVVLCFVELFYLYHIYEVFVIPSEMLVSFVNDNNVILIVINKFEINKSKPKAFNHFVTLINAQQSSARYFDHCKMSVFKKCCSNLIDKILKEDK